MLPKLKQFFETIVVTEILTGHMKNSWTRTSAQGVKYVTKIIDVAQVSRFHSHTPNNTGLVRKANKSG
jgi:hypothetical protein